MYFKNVGSDIVNSNISYTKKYQDHVPCSFAYKLLCVDNKYSKKLFCAEEKMLLMCLLNRFLMSTIFFEKIMKKYFNKNLVMSAKENELFEMTNIC